MLQLTKHLTTLFLIASFNVGCAYSQAINTTSIIGTWHLNKKQVNYPTITFDKNTAIAVITSRGDTVYRYHYALKGKKLLLTDIFNKTIENPIISLGKDTLVFKRLLDNKTKQVYLRTK